MPFRILLCTITVAVLQLSAAHAQVLDRDILAKYKIYDEDRLSTKFHKTRRDSIRASMADGSIAVFLSAPLKNRANDVDYEYHQDPSFYYLTGHLQPNAALVITKTKDILFVDKKEPAREQWTGVRLGTEGATELLGFQEAYTITELKATLGQLLGDATTLYYDPPTAKKHHEAALDTTINLWDMTVAMLKTQHPKVSIASLRPRIAELRMRKTPEEVVLLRKAINISSGAHNEIMRQVKPGWTEYQIQALGEYVFKKNGCEYTGYPCIVGTGNNGAVLHYITNRAPTLDGDIVVMDIGGEYHGYTADVTRTFPVNGKFTGDQRSIYNLVLVAQDSGIAQCRAGKPFRAAHAAAVRVIQKGLVKLGITKDTGDYRQYFMHGTSHYLGLDVHDQGTGGALEPGVVMTVEPGIYIPEGSPCDKKWWNISCRIEDDILITNDAPEILSISSPRTADEVEKLMMQSQLSAQPGKVNSQGYYEENTGVQKPHPGTTDTQKYYYPETSAPKQK